MKALHQVSRDYAGLAGQGKFTPFGLSIALGAEVSNVILATCQLLDARGAPIKVANVPILFWVSANTAGDYALGVNLTGMTIPTYGQRYAVLIANTSIAGVTNLNGIVEVRLYLIVTSSRRLCAMLPGGTIVQSEPVVFA